MMTLVRGRAFALLPIVALAAALVVATAGSCLPDYEFGGSSGGSALCNAPQTSSDPTLHTLLDPAEVATVTGNAQQQHLIYVTGSSRWWLFYIDSESKHLKTRWSYDLATWTPAQTLTLPLSHGGEGRNFSVAHRVLKGVDVIHVATSLQEGSKRVVYDTRATISCGDITFGTPSFVHDFDDVIGPQPDAGPLGSSGCDPDGNGVAIGADGQVYVSTAWVAVAMCCTCDSNVFTSDQIDDGLAWDGRAAWKLRHFTVQGTSNAHQIVALSTGNMVSGWEAADDIPPTNLRFATKAVGVWNHEDDSRFDVFPPAMQHQAENDWSICRIADDNVHIVRRKGLDADAGSQSAVFDHSVLNGNAWTPKVSAVPLANDRGLFGSGVVLLTNGTGMLAATIADDGAGTVRYATWTSASGWSAWKSLTTISAARTFISGSGCADPKHPTLIWTEGAAAGPYKIVGAEVSTLFQ